jgi:hypothetical protein
MLRNKAAILRLFYQGLRLLPVCNTSARAHEIESHGGPSDDFIVGALKT